MKSLSGSSFSSSFSSPKRRNVTGTLTVGARYFNMDEENAKLHSKLTENEWDHHCEEHGSTTASLRESKEKIEDIEKGNDLPQPGEPGNLGEWLYLEIESCLGLIKTDR